MLKKWLTDLNDLLDVLPLSIMVSHPKSYDQSDISKGVWGDPDNRLPVFVNEGLGTVSRLKPAGEDRAANRFHGYSNHV